ncbi:hypothetical protein, partial [Flavobacterium succinicans]|uniref:hypothetical protein n=1 Tax=Flavobacterium succinicans TaxID=29536 RepID=UPI001B8D8B25
LYSSKHPKKISRKFIVKKRRSLSGTVQLPPTFPRYSGFGTKLSPIFGFAKSSQIQNQLSIKPIAQIRCSVCWQ